MALMNKCGKLNFQNRDFVLVFFCALIAAIAPFYFILFDWSKVLLFRDIQLSFLPAKKIWLESVSNFGHIPIWNHLGLGGVPYWADCNQQPLYPLNFIFLLFSSSNLIIAFSYFLAAHYFLLFIGAFFLFREWQLEKFEAILFAFVAAWCGVAIGANNLPHILGGQLAAYWFLWSLVRIGKAPNLGNAFILSFWWAWPLFAGDPQYPYIFGFVAFIYALVNYRQRKAWLILFTGGILTVFLSAPQLLPTLELTKETVRADLEKNVGFSLWAFHPVRVWEIIFPQLLGNIAPRDNYIGSQFVNFEGARPFLFSVYLSLPVMFFAIFGLFRKEKKRLFLLFTILLSFWVTFGVFVKPDLYLSLVDIIPFWGLFRYSERLVVVPMIGLIIAAAFGAKAWLRGERLPKLLWVFSGFFLVVIFFISINENWSLGFQHYKEPLKQAAAFFAIFLFITFLYEKKIIRPEFSLGLLATVILLEFLLNSRAYIWEQSREFTFIESHPHVQKVRMDLDRRKEEIARGAAERVHFQNSFEYDWNYTGTREKVGLLNVESVGGWRNLSGNIGFLFDFSLATGYYTLQLSAPTDLWHYLKRDPARLMDILGVRYIRPMLFQGIPEIRVNPDAVPYLLAAKDLTGFMSELAIQRNLFHTNINLMERVFVRLQNVTEELPKNLQSDLQFSQLVKDFHSIRFRVSSRDPESIPAAILVNERYSPYWAAKVNGEKVEVRQANAWATLLIIPGGIKGDAEVLISYEDPKISMGVKLFYIWLFLLLSYLIFLFSKKAADKTKTPVVKIVV